MGVLSRILSALALGVFALYQVGGFFESRSGARGPLTDAIGDIFWMNGWLMFTGYSKKNSQVEFDGLAGGKWSLLPVEEWFPASWESGHRWDRPAFMEPRAHEPFLAAICDRSGVEQVRIVKRTWPKTMGQVEQPRRKVKEEVLRVWICGTVPRRPNGSIY